MSDPDFPEELRSFIQEAIPTVDSAELLVLLATHRDRHYSLVELLEAMRPTIITEAAARRYLGTFYERGIISARADDAYQYSPSSPELDATVRALTRVYNERPVTLVRVIYAPKDEKIRSFADAFRIKK